MGGRVYTWALAGALALAAPGRVAAQFVSPPLGVPGTAPYSVPWTPYVYRAPSISTAGGGPSSADYTGVLTPNGYWPPSIPSTTFTPNYQYIFYAIPQPVYVPVPVVTPRPAVELVQSKVVTVRAATAPAELQLQPGTVLTWTNGENRARTVVLEMPVAAGASAESGRQKISLPPNGTLSLAFNQPGAYPYYLEDQPERRARIVVEAPAGS